VSSPLKAETLSLLNGNQLAELEKNAVVLLGKVRFEEDTLEKNFLSSQLEFALTKLDILKLEDISNVFSNLELFK
jgi:hypothetical protein